MSVFIGVLAFLWLGAGLLVVLVVGYVTRVVQFDKARFRVEMAKPRSLPESFALLVGVCGLLVVVTACVHWACVMLWLLR